MHHGCMSHVLSPTRGDHYRYLSRDAEGSPPTTDGGYGAVDAERWQATNDCGKRERERG
jgi:hypothetical protein